MARTEENGRAGKNGYFLFMMLERGNKGQEGQHTRWNWDFTSKGVYSYDVHCFVTSFGTWESPRTVQGLLWAKSLLRGAAALPEHTNLLPSARAGWRVFQRKPS